eukprot:CAMPEP_0113466104 /NCGR_PEP_ID=MMETSP0014_2-20120614/14094_1 /TAXON_ID=2857 /ORGANISM="Nitzschia sp." /LENGTH=239 /DNA_ID=CAMNT_0000358305 /DNA_START=562 /DNA_END=1281 /DNA_ORIENTATION=- /assembly_acc=CAM_ASM_000159
MFDDDDGEETEVLDFDHDDQFQRMVMDREELMEEIKSKMFFPVKDDDVDEERVTTMSTTTPPSRNRNQNQQQTYRMGGDAHYTTGMVDPSSLSREDADDCDEPYVDLMTGDELCWGVDPTGMDRNVIVGVAESSNEFVFSSKEQEEEASAPKTTKININKTIKVDELYRSGGHAEFNHPFHLQHHDQDRHLTYEPTLNDRKNHHLLYHKHPTLLTEQEVEDCTGEPYIDFATGDELCWP